MSRILPQQRALYVMTSLFFIWGFITALNDILIPHLKAEFSLSYSQAMLVQFCFFGAYFIVSPLAGRVIAKLGYIKGAYLGLATLACGCLLFIPAANIKAYWLFLAALFVLAAGITVLQVAANPYIACLGEQKHAASRLNLAQAINSLGHTLGPVFGAALILGAVTTTSADQVKLPYLIIAISAIMVAVLLKLTRLPEIEVQAQAKSTGSIWQQKQLLWGALAIFLYVGAEVSIGSFLVNYFEQPDIGGLTTAQAGHLVAYYWGGAMVGRFIGAALMRYFAPFMVLGFNALIVCLLLITTVTTTGHVAMISVLLVGFFNSIMFPTIFALAIKGLGTLTAKGSGLLCQAIVGGALFPLLQAFVADHLSLQVSFLVPIVAYVYILFFALKQRRGEQSNEAIA